MSVPVLEPAFTLGEVTPGLFGRFDLARLHTAASTMRNMWPGFRGGAYSRAGTAFVGFSKQTGRAYPPRLIPFQFSINQGLVLEFGNFYMRVISDGGFVTDLSANITNITQANPAVVTMTASGTLVATPNDGAVSSSYAPLDKVTLAGGVFSIPAVLEVTNTKLLSIGLSFEGTGVYAAGDLVFLAGGTQSAQSALQVTATRLAAVTGIVTPGSYIFAGGTPPTFSAVLGSTNGAGTGFLITGTMTRAGFGWELTAVTAIDSAGNFTTNPTTGAEPLVVLSSPYGPATTTTAAEISLSMGIANFTIANAGIFTANPVGGNMTQLSSTGAGVGATFFAGLFGPNTVSVFNPGVYTTLPSNPVAQASTTGTGLGVTFNLFDSPAGAFATGDWVELSGIGGMVQLNGQTAVLTSLGGNQYSLHDIYGNPINSMAYGAYTSGGVALRIYTLTTIYSEVDLDWLKFAQSADVMTLCCVNQISLVDYPPQDLARASDSNWSFSPVVPGESVNPPGTPSVSPSASGNLYYQYVVTSISPTDGSESVASPIGEAGAAVDIASTAGQIGVSWPGVAGVLEYNIYKATPGFGGFPGAGALFGYVGSSGGDTFIDDNIIADFSQTPPEHDNPFAVAGEYPGVPSYFQERAVFGFTLDNPDTYYMSQPGAFSNFDFRTPTIDSDAITGSPWSLEVNGIQWMLLTPGGLLTFTGLSVWLLVGAGGFATNAAPITPSQQDANPQPEIGCAATVNPIKIDYDVLYVSSKTTIYYDLPYQLYALSQPIDITINSSQLFQNFTIVQHAWAREPYKILWAVRNDGILLSLTWLKPEQVAGWARHDTFGSFVAVCSVTEPASGNGMTPVDAVYLATHRTIGTNQAYIVERMNNRQWTDVESTWCVDCGFSLPQPQSAATLTASSATGLGAVSGIVDLVGGANYSADTYAVVSDAPLAPLAPEGPVQPAGPGNGAVFVPTIVGGVITGGTFTFNGQQYLNPQIQFIDPAGSGGGSGASATCVLDNTMTFSASAAVFSPTNVGSFIRVGGGIAEITAYTDSQHVTANILSPIVDLVPNSGGIPSPALSGDWTMTVPVSTLFIPALAGATLTGLADGNVIPPTVVGADGTMALPVAASAITVGFGFQAQLQSVYLDTGEPTVQGQRKKIPAATARLESSRGVKMGSNQPDGSTLSPPQVAPQWTNLDDVPDLGITPYNALAQPLYTGDARITIQAGFQKPGQVALQQDLPLPMQVLALIPELDRGDVAASPKQKKAA